MENKKYEYTLHDILCLRNCGEASEIYGIDNYEKAVIEWAEREVISGNHSDMLLILASLGLDKIPDPYEVEHYLLACVREKNLTLPDAGESAVVWLKITTWFLLHATSSRDIEIILYRLHSYSYFSDFYLVSSITSRYYGLYLELFDDWGPEYPSKASAMSESEILDFVKCRIKPFYRILCNTDWAWLLAR